VTPQPWVGPLVDIPIEKGLLFRAKPFKNNPEGISVLRNSYVPYYYMKRLQEQEAIWAERMSGVPVMSVPSELFEAAQAGDSKAAAAIEAFKRIVTNVRQDEQMGILKPSNVWQNPGDTGSGSAEMYKFELVVPQRGGSFDWEKTITRYSVQMMTSVLADFLQLGHESRGTQSLAVSKVDMFFQAIEGFLNSSAAVIDRFGTPRLWKLNGMDQDLMPHIEPDLAQRVDLDVLSQFVLRLSQSGMPLFPNEDLQSYILDAAGLPDVSDDRALQAAGMADHQLDRDDEKQDVALDRMKEPPPPPMMTPLQKMIAASVARRMIRHGGPRFGISTRKRAGQRHAHKRA